MNSGEDSAFPMSSSSGSASHQYDGSVSMSTDSSWKIAAEVSESSKLSSGLAHNLSKGCISPGCSTPHSVGAHWVQCSAFSTTWRLKSRTENR